ncbi:ELWxxDGT repeat protein [Emticicia sp. C21]|uniref:ELWxxDGT repeat protein n=1 Tax=Emticicia sp. C21 TaxID=2302915 RepID=UPI000E345204|nr:ELWxxDGT repeat protein [Emticicia sp. C21]RFS14124.1 hypothetical protein D0T08_23030 [Emticicia sp. C21]
MKKPLLLIILIIAVALPSFSQRVLKDIAQGTDNAYVFPYSSFSYGDTLYFRANSSRDNSYNYYLTTGAALSAKLLPTNNSLSSGFINNYASIGHFKFKNKLFILVENALYFKKNDSLQLIKYLSSTQYDVYFINSFEINNRINFLVYNNSVENFEFWKTDGTEAGTILYKSIHNDTPISAWGSGFFFNKKYYHAIGNSTNNFLISDGTSNGTTLQKNHRISIDGLQSFGSKIYFTKPGTGQYYYRTKLWESKGDSTSTHKLISSVDGDTTYAVSSPFKFKDNLYLSTYINDQQRISKFDTNSLIFTPVTREIIDGKCFVLHEQKFYYGITEGYFVNFYENSGSLVSERLIFTLPLSEVDEAKIYTLHVGSGNYYVSEQKIESGGIYGDVVYWVYNGAAVKKITDLNSNLKLGLQNNLLGVVGNILYFSATDSQHGYELWRTDGTTAGTFMINDINKEIASSNPSILFTLKDQLYFLADDIVHGSELWRTNGNETNLYADVTKSSGGGHVAGSYYLSHIKYKSSYLINIGFNQFQISSGENIKHLPFISVAANSNIYEFNDSLYYIGTDSNLWKTDGTILGTKKAVHLDSTNNGTGNIGSQILGHINEILFFTTNYGSAIWKTDGKKSGTIKLHEFGEFQLPSTGKFNTYKSWTNNQFFFFERINNTANKFEIWRSDGTIAGTIQLPINEYIKGLGIFNNKFYFTNSNQLWVSDGTVAGTVKIDDRNFSFASELNNKYILVAANSGLEYYEIDKNNSINYLNTIGIDNFFLTEFYSIDNRYLLNIVTTDSFHDFYLTDGNQENIRKVFSIKNMGNNPNAFSLAYLNKKIYFTAIDSLKGNELWIWDFECPDGYTIRDNITKDSTIVYGKNIWGQNIVSNNTTVTYDAKNGITLQPGFEVQKGTVFKTKLIGCTNNNSANISEDNLPTKNEPLIKVNNASTYPQLIDFLYYYPNKSIKEIYEQAERSKLAPITWDIVTEKDIYILDLKIGSTVLKGFLPKK